MLEGRKCWSEVRHHKQRWILTTRWTYVEVAFSDGSNSLGSDSQVATQAVNTVTILTTTLGIMTLFINKQTARHTSGQTLSTCDPE